MASEIPPEVSSHVIGFGEELSRIEDHISPLLGLNMHQIQSTLSPLERAKLNVAIAYAINSLYHSEPDMLKLTYADIYCSVFKNERHIRF